MVVKIVVVHPMDVVLWMEHPMGVTPYGGSTLWMYHLMEYGYSNLWMYNLLDVAI